MDRHASRFFVGRASIDSDLFPRDPSSAFGVFFPGIPDTWRPPGDPSFPCNHPAPNAPADSKETVFQNAHRAPSPEPEPERERERERSSGSPFFLFKDGNSGTWYPRRKPITTALEALASRCLLENTTIFQELSWQGSNTLALALP